MSKDYVTEISGAYRISGTRVSLDSVVLAWHEGLSPESIVESYPTLTLEQVHGALAYYLAHQEDVDKYLLQGESEWEEFRTGTARRLRETKPSLYERLMAHKQTVLSAKNAPERE